MKNTDINSDLVYVPDEPKNEETDDKSICQSLESFQHPLEGENVHIVCTIFKRYVKLMKGTMKLIGNQSHGPKECCFVWN